MPLLFSERPATDTDKAGHSITSDSRGSAWGRVEEAITAWQAAAAIFAEIGDRRGEEMAVRALETA
jgi:hypothetical protein